MDGPSPIPKQKGTSEDKLIWFGGPAVAECGFCSCIVVNSNPNFVFGVVALSHQPSVS
jgi:hypothetical protein